MTEIIKEQSTELQYEKAVFIERSYNKNLLI